jgi:amino acid transporter
MTDSGTHAPLPSAGDVERALERSLGVRSLAASILNISVVGVTFQYKAIVAAGLCAAAWLAYVVCAVAFRLIVLFLAEAGSRVKLDGGPYAYVGTVFGPFVGYLSGVLLWLLAVQAHAAIANGFVKGINAFFPGAGVGIAHTVMILVVFAFFAAVNVRGVRQGARLIEVATVAKLRPLAVFVLFGLFAMSPSNLAWPGMPMVADLGRMSILLVFAFSGVESALAPSGTVEDPARTVQRAIGIAMVGITLLYVAVQVVAQGILGADLARHTDAPLAAAAAQAFGPAGGLLLLVGASVSMFGYLSGMMLAMPRTLFAFARDGYLPAALARVNPKTHVPAAAIVAHAAAVSALAISGTFESLAILSNISALLLYLLCSAAVLELRRRDVREAGEPFRIPGGAAVPVLSMLVILFLLSNATGAEMRSIGIALLIAVALYLLRRRTPAAAAP